MSSVYDRFWSKVDKCGEDECWEWTGFRLPSGYGRLWNTAGKPVLYPHRLSYEIHIGEIDDGYHVCHHCDNPACVNPSHLFVGTATDNARDRAKKGRNGSKLTPSQARKIRQRIEAGDALEDIAESFGVVYQTVYNIKRGATWSNL